MIKKRHLDFLKIKLQYFNNLDILDWLVDNSNIRYINQSMSIQFDKVEKDYKTYFITDSKNNKLWLITIVDDKNKRFDFYNNITFYWTFFNLYSNSYIFDIFQLFNLNNKNAIMRVDIAEDHYNNYSVKSIIYKDSVASSVRSHHTYWIESWKNLQKWEEYDLKVYNKRLDILDKKLKYIQNNDWNFIYKDMYDKYKTITRIELKLKRDFIKKRWIYLHNIFKLDTIFDNLCARNFKDFWTFKRNNLNKSPTIEDISYIFNLDISTNTKDEKSIKHTNIMMRSYIEKLYDIYWKKLARKKLRVFMAHHDPDFIFYS
jgi:hypothetical protein